MSRFISAEFELGLDSESDSDLEELTSKLESNSNSEEGIQ